MSGVSNGGIRPGVRAATEIAAAAEFRFNDTCIALVSSDLADELAEWSKPVEMKVARSQNGLLDIEIRSANGSHDNLNFCIERCIAMEKAIEHVLRYGKLGKQSQRRLEEALRDS